MDDERSRAFGAIPVPIDQETELKSIFAFGKLMLTQEALMKKILSMTLVALGFAAPANAISIALHSDNQGIGSIEWNVDGNNINIWEYWTQPGSGILEISGLRSGISYTVNKYVYNSSGQSWYRFANELLDSYVAGSEDDLNDAKPYPGWIPAGYSTSSDEDGLSFAQGLSVPRSSTVFSSVLADETTNSRDFLDYYDGLLADGADGIFTFGLRYTAGDEAFLLVQRPNVESAPTPDVASTSGLLGLAMIGLSLVRRATR
jgi:hypothetical protein